MAAFRRADTPVGGGARLRVGEDWHINTLETKNKVT